MTRVPGIKFMTDADHRVPGTVGWVDLNSTDAAAAAMFYAELFGWRRDVATTPLGDYDVCFRGQHAAAGIRQQPHELEAAGLAPGWTTYFRVAELNAALAAADALGAKVALPPVRLRGRARAAVLVDPYGAEFGLFEATARVGLHIRTERGAPCWAEMVTAHMDPAEHFYTSLFGWGTATAPGDLPYTTYTRGHMLVAGLLRAPDVIPVDGPRWLPYFAVDDCRVAVAGALRLGGATVTAPTEGALGRFAVLTDPLGTAFGVFSARRPG